MTKIKSSPTNFENLGINKKIIEILQHWNFKEPTPIQHMSIPVAIEGKDIVGIAQTGTGKTLAFGIPMIQHLAQSGDRGLVLLPTRELALQINESLKEIAYNFGLKTSVLVGGEPKRVQLKSLRQKPNIIIATPGRLIDYIKTNTVSLERVKILVLDEADLMFDIGFAPQIFKILKTIPPKRQTLLFSATMPASIMELVAKHMRLPVNIEVAPSGTPAEKVEQKMIVIKKENRTNLIQKALSSFSGSVLIFCRTKHGVKNLTIKIREMGHKVGEIHSNRSLKQRTTILKAFKTAQIRILVATDIAARGIDVKNIELVLNYDLPENAQDYIHRIGRTGRAGNFGKAISFVSPNEIRKVKKIEQIIKKTIPLSRLNNFHHSLPNSGKENERKEKENYSFNKRVFNSDSPKKTRHNNWKKKKKKKRN